MPRPFITPTAISKASRCLHTWYLECFGDRAQKAVPDAGVALLIKRGEMREQQRLTSLPVFVKPQWDGTTWEAGVSGTTELLRAGHPWIYQGVLKRGSLRGVPDLLQRVDGTSSFGAYTYRPVDIKDHQAVTPKDRFQLSAYAELLEPLLGHRPGQGAIWVGSGALEPVDLRAHEADFRAILGQMEDIAEGRLVPPAYRCSECRGCPWAGLCESRWQASEHVSLLAGVSASAARKLCGAGLSSWKKLAGADLAQVVELFGAKKTAAARDLWLHAKAWDSGKPQFRESVQFPSGVPIHFYDIETFDGRVYLHGDVRVLGGLREERQFFADDPTEEESVWHQFLDWLARDTECVVYCWASYEVGFAHSLWQRFGGNPRGWAHLERSLRDQKEFVKRHFALPVTTYSIKEVAPAFGFRWDADDAGGLNSESWYGEWLTRKDPALKRKILRYNLDDVVAMEIIDRELRLFAGRG